MFAYFYWNPNKEIFTIPGLNIHIVWYSLFFLIGFLVGYYIFLNLLKRYYILKNGHNNPDIEQIKRKSVKFLDKLTVYVVISTIIGARLGHLFFYEKPSFYLKNPINILKVWEGGLASHGAAVAIMIGLYFFYKATYKEYKILYVKILDFISAPTAFAGFCIRIGNFFNQEIVGIETSKPWGIIFGSGEYGLIPRHPVQLYESFFYLIAFFLLFYLSKKAYFLINNGKIFGLFLILIFGFRFIIEFIKLKQSYLLTEPSLLMGQYLSIPFIILGILFLFFDEIKSFFLNSR